jgi:hypothetical protein
LRYLDPKKFSILRITYSGVSGLRIEKNILKSIFSKKNLKNVRTPKFVSRKKNILLKIFKISVEKYLKKIFFGRNIAFFKNDDFE